IGDEQPLIAPTTPEVEQSDPTRSASSSLFIPEEEAPMLEEEAIRPFTDFIEEFRQTEVRLNVLLNEPEPSFTGFVADGEGFPISAEDLARIMGEAPVELSGIEQQEKVAKASTEAGSTEETRTSLAQPTLPAERPVSPLLRPATRLRL